MQPLNGFGCEFVPLDGRQGIASQVIGIKQCGRKRGAQLVRKIGRHLAHGSQALITPDLLLHGIGFGDVVDQQNLSAC